MIHYIYRPCFYANDDDLIAIEREIKNNNNNNNYQINKNDYNFLVMKDEII